ncbi:hypothetical protein DMH17_17145 [Raoultella planticola]|nr:hypothetical protein [Raoultella planticola]
MLRRGSSPSAADCWWECGRWLRSSLPRDSIGATSGLITQLTLIGVFLDRRCFSMHCKTTPATRSLCWCWRGWRSVWSVFQSGYGIQNHKPAVEQRAPDGAASTNRP